MFVSDKGCMPPSHVASFSLVWSAVDLIFRLSAQSATRLVFASMVISNSYPIKTLQMRATNPFKISFSLTCQQSTMSCIVHQYMQYNKLHPDILNEVNRLKCQILPGALLPLFFSLAKVFLVVVFDL